MTEIPKGALEKANDLLFSDDENSPTRNVARYIADVSETAAGVDRFLASAGYSTTCPARIDLSELILPNPEDDLLKEAREICARLREKADFSDARNYLEGIYDATYPMRCTLAALRKGRE